MNTIPSTTALQAEFVDQALLALLQALVVVGFLAVGVAAAYLFVRALRTEHGRLRDREARFVLAGAAVLFVVGFARLVTVDAVAHESLAAVALGFTAVVYLLSLARPALFDVSASSENGGVSDDGTVEGDSVR
jgi:hypothetical protein